MQQNAKYLKYEHFLNVPENLEQGWFGEIFSWKVIFPKRCFHRTFSDLLMCQGSYMSRVPVQSYIKQNYNLNEFKRLSENKEKEPKWENKRKKNLLLQRS